MAMGVETTGRTQRRVSCCLCLRPLLDASAVKKRKLLHNDSCKKSKEVLNEVLLSKLALSTHPHRRQERARYTSVSRGAF